MQMSETAGAESGSHAAAIIAGVLASAERLALDDKQIAAVSRLYWSSGRRPGAAEVDALGDLLSAAQFRAAIARFAGGVTAPAEMAAGSLAGMASTPLPSAAVDLDELLTTALDKRLKDRAVVEVELASKVADRLIGWSKSFAAFVALPVAALLLVLSLFGLSKFEDVRKAADRADELLSQSTTRLEQSNAKLAQAELRVRDLTERVTQRSLDVDSQLAALRATSARADAQISSLGQSVRQIETRLGGLSAQSETGNRPAGFVSRGFRVGGREERNYGPWGIDTTIAGQLTVQADFPWRDNFAGHEPGSGEFNAAWEKLGEREPDRFREAQRAYLEAHFFAPAAARLSRSCGLDVRTRSRALQDVVWSQAIWDGPAVRFATAACTTLKEQNMLDPADNGLDERLIRETYARAMNAPAGGTFFRERFQRELSRALEQLAHERVTATPPGPR